MTIPGRGFGKDSGTVVVWGFGILRQVVKRILKVLRPRVVNLTEDRRAELLDRAHEVEYLQGSYRMLFEPLRLALRLARGKSIGYLERRLEAECVRIPGVVQVSGDCQSRLVAEWEAELLSARLGVKFEGRRKVRQL